jgi:L-cystine uptake protein TcyP (sodium:dicarboxylate symporter family)
MVVVPLVFASLIVGTASLGDITKLGRISGKTVVYYICTTAIAVTIGLVGRDGPHAPLQRLRAGNESARRDYRTAGLRARVM